MLKYLGVSRSGYRSWLNRTPSDTEKRREYIKAKIQDIYDQSKQNYGAPKITRKLRQKGETISERTVGKYMKEMGHGEAQMFFSVDRAARLAEQIGPHAIVLAEKPYYRNIDKSGLKFFTKISMIVSDHFHMVKMIHLKLERA